MFSFLSTIFLFCSGLTVDGESKDELQWIKGKAMSLNDCLNTKWGSNGWTKPSEDNICFRNNYENNESACQGDSGGPLVCNVDGKAVLLGATSYGSIGWPCVDDGYPNIYARVTFFLSWIKENMVTGINQSSE